MGDSTKMTDKKLVGIKVDKRYVDFDGEAEYTGYVIVEIDGKYVQDSISEEFYPHYADEMSSKDYTKYVTDKVKARFGLKEIPKDVIVKYEDCTQYPRSEERRVGKECRSRWST